MGAIIHMKGMFINPITLIITTPIILSQRATITIPATWPLQGRADKRALDIRGQVEVPEAAEAVAAAEEVEAIGEATTNRIGSNIFSD